MTWINLGNPKPKQSPDQYIPFIWNTSIQIPLDIPKHIPENSFASILDNRRTRRSFNSIPHNSISGLLWMLARQQFVGHQDYGYPISLRPAPSAGAIHPIHLLISDRKNDSILRYNPESHVLETIATISTKLIEEAIAACDLQDGELLIFAAEPGKTQAKYHAAESLIWRDAGILLGYLSLLTPLFDLNFCPLGMTGDNWVSSLDEKGRLQGVGTAILGSNI